MTMISTFQIFFGLSAVGFDASLSILKSLDLYLDNSLWGLRWQFLNHDSGPENWVASLQAAYGAKDYDSSSGAGSAKSKIKTTQFGGSVGYKLQHLVPYVSYIRESHDTTTDVTNSFGNFDGYDDKGVHNYYGIGVGAYGKGLSYGIEYNRIDIKWDRAPGAQQDALELNLASLGNINRTLNSTKMSLPNPY